MEPSSGPPWIVALPSNATVTRVLRDIGTCVRRWTEADARSGGTAHARDASVNIASPSVARHRPAGRKPPPTAVRARLRASHPDVVVSEFHGVWRLEPGTVDRLTGYVLYCERPDGEKRCLGDRAAAVSTDVRGEPVGVLREIGKVREGRGALRLPPL